MAFQKTPRTTASRYPNQRLFYEEESVFSILDASLFCTVSYVIDGMPFALPTAFVREGYTLYLHGSVGSHMIREIEKGLPVCITVFLADSLVVAKSAFHHSVNYRSAVLFAKAEKVTDPDLKYHVLKIFTEKIVPGSWDYLRPMTSKEMDKTTVLAFTIDEASAKKREGMPKDDEEDNELPLWSGLIPLETKRGTPLPSEVAADIELPSHLQ
jgi:nitroimidazol reductase NimA-like FMN-containing flavoprotein (pyridoxamine 5'-phosphate oxidase superfamily)